MIFSIFLPASKFDNNKFLILMTIMIITVTIDSQIGYIADFIPNQLSSIWGIGVFFSKVVVFALLQYFILSYPKEIKNENKTRVYHVDKSIL